MFGAREYTLGDKGNCASSGSFLFLGARGKRGRGRGRGTGPPFLQSQWVAKRQLDAQNKLTNKITFVEK